MSEALNVSVDSAGIEPNAAENFNDELQADSEEFETDEGEESSEEEQSEKKLTKEEIKRIKKLQLKFNGREYEEELPFEIEDNPDNIEWMKKQLQLAKLGHTKSQDYSKLENEIRDFVSELKKNPRKMLSNPNLGIDLKELAAQILEEEIENSKKTPEQIELEKAQLRLKELEDERAREQEDLRNKEYQRLLDQQYERYDIQMSKALQSSDLPKSPYIVKKMADYMILGVKNGISVTPEDVIPLVKEELQSDLKDMFDVLPDEVLTQLIGKNNYDRIRKHNVSKAKKKINPSMAKKKIEDTGKISKPTQNEESKISFKDFFGAGL